MNQRLNPWHAFNLRASPYFQDGLSQNFASPPLRLFVGRQRERQRLMLMVEGSLTGSRQAVAKGVQGVAKPPWWKQ